MDFIACAVFKHDLDKMQQIRLNELFEAQGVPIGLTDFVKEARDDGDCVSDAEFSAGMEELEAPMAF